MMASKNETPPPPKTKRSEGGVEIVCVVHVEELKYEAIKPFSTVSDPQTIFLRLQDIKRRRLAQPIDSPYRLESTCELIPDILDDNHGYHQICYQRFCANLHRLDTPSIDSQVASTSRSSRKESSGDSTLFKPDCIFCNSEGRRKVKNRGTWTTEGMSVFDRDGGKFIQALAEKRDDQKLLTRIRGVDMFACEAKYHRACHTKYCQDPIKWRSSDKEEKQKQESMVEAHAIALASVCEIVDDVVLKKRNILKLTHLCETYRHTLEKSDHKNPNFRGENLKAKLEKHYGSHLSFCSLGPFHSYILYNSNVEINQVMKYAYELGSKDMIETAATCLHQDILAAFKDSKELKWPPTAQSLVNSDIGLPPSLEKFLSNVLYGTSSPSVQKSQRLVSSFAQDICRAATNGEWKLPKHVLMCLTLRHMFRSERLVTILNRFGHSENYSFSLELETAVAQCVEEFSTLLTNQIVHNPGLQSLFHSEFDNFDMLINDMTGGGSVHTAHGIMLQEISGVEGTRREIPSVPGAEGA